MATQLPNVPFAQRTGSDSVIISGNPTTKVVTLPSGVFTAAPVVLVQVTTAGTAVATITAKSATDFTVSIAGGSGTITFDWVAIQQSA
jgi:hypothetical protein